MSNLSNLPRTLIAILVGPFKPLLRRLERGLARRISERYADEIAQFAQLNQAMSALRDELHARLDKQEGFQWDHIALARRLASLEDHLDRLLADQEKPEEDTIAQNAPQNVVRFAPITNAPEVPVAEQRIYRMERAG
jgi:hypothetical protein